MTDLEFLKKKLDRKVSVDGSTRTVTMNEDCRLIIQSFANAIKKRGSEYNSNYTSYYGLAMRDILNELELE